MPTKAKSPYAATYRAAVRSGTPTSKAVAAIARTYKTTTTTVYASLYKAGVCNRQKCAGQWVYWPCDGAKTSPRYARYCQAEIWQQVIDWCIATGKYKPQQITNNAANQQKFVTFCHRAIGTFNRKPATAARTTARKATSYKFPQTTTARRYRRAA